MTAESHDRAGLAAGFLRSRDRVPTRTAVEVDGTAYSYDELFERSAAIAATVQSLLLDGPPLTAVLAHRSITAFAGILGALLAGHGYVPLNPQLPTARTGIMLEHSRCRSIVVGPEAVRPAIEILADAPAMHVLCPDEAVAAELAAALDGHTIHGPDALASAAEWREPTVAPTDTAYVLFTSGSTGAPKGVQVAHGNIAHFLAAAIDRYEFTEHDRFSHMFELVFDLSLFDLFVAWECGATVCCPDAGDAQLPARFVIESRITVWFSVPSLGLLMKQMRMLEPGIFPDLRLVLFCGEALLAETAEAWTIAAPNARIENLYGPTEVTLCCTWYPWNPDTSPGEARNGVVPIGEPFPGMTAIVVDDQLRPVPSGEPGELLMSGPQVAIGYWHDADKTNAAFVVPPGQDSVFYRTGDLVHWHGGAEPIQYLGRIDHQLKIRGNRVELGEVEAAIRAVAEVDHAVAVGWPRTPGGADGIVAFVETGEIDARSTIKGLRRRLPRYMVPRTVIAVERFPLNVNGKVDRLALAAQLEAD